jgi:hypothetical protein
MNTDDIKRTVEKSQEHFLQRVQFLPKMFRGSGQKDGINVSILNVKISSTMLHS